MEPQLVDFSVIKQKIIKTDEILQMYLETEKKLKKAQVMNKNLKVQATTSLNRLKLENERYTFTIESSKTKCDDLQSENQQLMEQKSSLEKKYSSLLVDSQSTILELQNELKMIKDLNASAEKLSVSPKRKTMHEKNSPKKFKELELKLQKVEENEKKLKKHNDILLIDRKQVADEITRIKIEHSKVIASLNMEKSKLECDIKQLCSQIDSEKRQHTIIRDKDHEISKLKAEVLALRELKEQIKHLQEQNKKLNSDILYKDVALYKAKEKMQEIQNVHTLHAETQTAPEPKVEPSKCNCIKNESLCKDKLMVCSITQTEPTTEDSDSNSHKAKDKILAIHNVHTEHAETQTDPKPEDKPPKCSCIKKQPLCMNKIMVSSNTQTEPLTGYSDSNMHKAKEKILAIQKGHIVHAETQTSSDPQMLPPKCSCFNKEPLCAKKITTCSFTQTDPLTADPVSKFKALNKDDVVDNIFKEMIFLPRMLSPMRNLSQDELIIDRLPKFLPSIPEIMITPSTPLEKNMPLFADIPANMESSDTIPRVETANQKIVNVPLAGKKLATGIFECDISKRGREVLQHKNDDIKVLDLRKCEENLVLKEINMENPSEPKCDNGLIKNGDEKNLVPEGIVTEVKTSNHECENELIQNRDDRIDTSDHNTSRKDIVPEEDVTEHFKYNSIQNGDDENLVPTEVITEPKTSKNYCEKESTQNRYDGINTLHLNTNQNNIVSQEIVTELKTSEECDNWSIHTRDNGIDTPDLNTSENNSVPEEVSAELKNHEYNNILSSERIEDVEQAKPTEKPLRKKKLGPSTRNSTFIKKQIAMKHANKKGLFKKRFMSRKLKTQDSVLRALQVLKQSKINFTISNESTLPLLLHEHDWLNKHCHTSTNFVPPPATKVPSTSKDKQSVERLRCSSSCCNKMFMLLSGKSRNPNLHGFFKVKKEQESPLYSRMDTTTDDQPGNPLKWLNESLKKEITPENLLDTLAELVSQKLRDNKSTKRKRSSPSENSEFFSETETEIERLFPNPKNTLERNKMLLKKAKYDLDMESTSVTSLEENDMKNVSSQTEEKSDSSLSKQLSQEQTVQELQMNEPSMPLVKIPVPDPRTPEKRNQTIEDADSCDSFGFTIHPDLLSPLSTSTVTESPKPKIVLATEFPSSIKNTADPKEIKRKIEFESSSCSEKKEFSSLLSPTNNESILGNEICSIGYTNSFSVVRNIQSHNTEIRNETATNNDVYHHTSKEKDDTHQNKLGNYVEGIFKLENTNICLLETKTNMSDDKPNSEVVDCKKYMLDPSSSFESSSDGGNIKNKQIKQSSINNVEVTPNSNTCINTSEKNISEDKLHYEVVDCEKNISDQSSSDVGNIENEQQTEASSVNNGEVTPNSDTCIKKSEIQSSGDKLTYDLVDCKKNISDLSGSIKSSFDMGEMENEQERSLWQRSQNVRSDQLSRIKMRPSLPTVNEIKKQEDWKEPHPKTSIIRRDVGRQDTSESDNQLDGPQSPKLSDDKFSVNDYIKPIPLEKDEYVSKKNEEDSPVTKKNEEDTLLSLRKGSKSDLSMVSHKKIYGLTTSDKAIQTFHPEEHTVGDCKRVNSPQSEISEPVKRKRGRPRKQKIETDHTAEFDVEQSNSNLQTVIQGKLELRNQAPKTLGTSKKIEAMKRRRTSKRLGGSLANSDEQGSTENVKNGTVIPEALYPRTKRLREGRQALSKEFIDSEGSESEYDAQNRTKKNCTETKISNGLLPNGNTAVTCTDESGITQRLPSISPKKTPSKKPKNKPMTKMKSNILRQMNIKRKMFRTDVPLSTARSIESNCDVKTKATDRFNVEIKDNSNKIRANMDVPKEPPPTKKKINVMQNFLIPPGDSNPVDLLKSDSPPNLIPEPSSSQDSLGLTETEATRTTRKPNRKGQPSNNSCDILSQIIGKMDKNRPAITVKPKLVNKEFPDGTQEKQWRSGVMDIAEIVHNKDARMEDPYGRLNFHVDGTGLLKKGAELTVRMKVMVKKLMNIPDEDDIPRAIILEFKRLKLEETIDIIIHEVAKDFRDKPIDKYYPAPLMTRTQRLYLNLLVSLENEVKDNVLDKFLSRTQQYIFKTGSRLKATVPLTRLFLSICRLKADINRMRTFCCEAFFYVGNLAVPILFTVLTSWIEVIPMAADVENYPIANVLVQLVHLKNFFLHGYNLIPLRCLLHQYHGYPKERRNCDELFEEVFHQYLRNPTPTSNFAIRLYCRNKENKWVYKKINEFFKPLIYKIPMENVNFKATVILMLGKISKQFKPKDEHDAVCLVELNRFFQDLLEDGMPDLVRQSVFWSIEGLPKKKPENPAQKSEGDSAGHSENPT